MFVGVRFLEGGAGGQPGWVEDREAAADVPGDDLPSASPASEAGISSSPPGGRACSSASCVSSYPSSRPSSPSASSSSASFLPPSAWPLFLRGLLGPVAGFAEEFLHRVVNFVLVRVDEAGPEFGREVDLLDFGPAEFVEQVEQFDQFVPPLMSELVYSARVSIRLLLSVIRSVGETWRRTWLRKLCWRAERTMSVSVCR